MSSTLSESCYCVSEGRIEPEVVEEYRCVCGCIGTTVSRFPNLFGQMKLSPSDVKRIREAGEADEDG